MAKKFRDRWGLPDEDIDKRRIKFLARIKLICGESKVVSQDEVYRIAFRLGCSPGDIAYPKNNYNNDWVFDLAGFITARDIETIASRLEIILDSAVISEKAKEVTSELIKTSALGFRLSKTKDGYQTYPTNIDVLDDKVEDVLGILEDKANERYSSALNAYKEGRWVDSADDTRRALEEYMRGLLANRKGLKANIDLLAKALKDRGNELIVANALNRTMRLLDDSYNEGTKHNSEINSSESAEYFIYQTAVIISAVQNLWDIQK